MSLTALSVPSNERKKKKLIVGGIGMNDTRRFEAMKKWCQVSDVLKDKNQSEKAYLHVVFCLRSLSVR